MVTKKEVWIIVILLGLTFMLVGCSESSGPTGSGGVEGYIYRDLNEDNFIDYVVSGEKKSSKDLTPVFAKIRTYNTSAVITYSNQTGYFKLEGLEEGHHELEFIIPVKNEMSDYFKASIQVEKNKITEVNHTD